MTIRISMWSGPRNMSTTMMRSFENRLDTEVFDEPAYAIYLRASGKPHPHACETMAQWPADDEALETAMTAPRAAPLFFAKHIAYHHPAIVEAGWLFQHRHFILIRHPRLMVRSFAAKLEDIAPIIDSYRIARGLRDRLVAAGGTCAVIDANDILADPRAALERLCAALGIPFDAEMLAWPAGPRASDGPWGPHWYDAVCRSTGFAAPAPVPGPLAAPLEKLADEIMPDYAALHAARLT